MPCVIHGQFLHPRTRQNTLYTHGDTLRRHLRPPPFPQQTETDIPVGVHVLVFGDAEFAVRDEIHRRGYRGVLSREGYPELEGFVFVDRARGAG